MSERKPGMGKSGVAWLVLIATPPVIILSGLVAMFVWQLSNGKVTPKWRKKVPSAAVLTNAPVVLPTHPVPAAGQSQSSEPAPR